MLPTAITSPTYGLYSPTQSTKGKILDTRMDSLTKDIQLGRADLNSWDDAVTNYRKSGADAIRNELEQALAIKGER